MFRSTFTAAGLAAALAVSGCNGITLTQVEQICQDAKVLDALQPRIDRAPPEVRDAAEAIRKGTVVCGSPEYAALRGLVVAWVAKAW